MKTKPTARFLISALTLIAALASCRFCQAAGTEASKAAECLGGQQAPANSGVEQSARAVVIDYSYEQTIFASGFASKKDVAAFFWEHPELTGFGLLNCPELAGLPQLPDSLNWLDIASCPGLTFKTGKLRVSTN